MEDSTEKRKPGWEGRTGRDHPTSKKVIQMHLNGRKIAVWDSLTIASEQTHVAFQNISNCCRNKRKSAGKFLWEFKYPILQMCVQMDLNDKWVADWSSIAHAAKTTEVNATRIIRCCKGEIKKAGGSKWKYK